LDKKAKRVSSQSRRFADAAKQVGASEDLADFDRVLGGIAKAPPPETIQDRKSPKAKTPTE
jgi:hypothetical protein